MVRNRGTAGRSTRRIGNTSSDTCGGAVQYAHRRGSPAAPADQPRAR